MIDPLSYQIRGGEGPRSIVYLHGFLGDNSEWCDVQANILPGHRALMIDLPGHGDSAPFCSLDGAIPKTAGSIIHLMGELGGFEGADLIAYSMGGRIALHLMTHYEAYFSQVVIESAFPGFRDPFLRLSRFKADRALARSLYHKGLPDFVEAWYCASLFESLRENSGFLDLRRQRSIGNAAHRAWAVEALSPSNQLDLWPYLEMCGLPILWIAGSRDEKYVRIVRNAAALCPKGVFCIMDGCGHNVHFENPAEVAKVIGQFLEDG